MKILLRTKKMMRKKNEPKIMYVWILFCVMCDSREICVFDKYYYSNNITTQYMLVGVKGEGLLFNF